MDNSEQYTSFIRVRLSASDAHYGGQLVNGAHMLSLFGDVATELAILCDGDEGLLVGYESIEFEARKVIAARRNISESAADVLETPIIVGRAIGTTVVKAEQQRKTHTAQ